MFSRYIIIFEHLPPSLFIGILFYNFHQNTDYFIVALIFGWLIDVDHLFDYYLWINKSNSHFSVKTFLNGSYFEKCGRVYLLFHAWEWSFILCLLGIFLEENNSFLLCAGLGLFVHLFQDHISNKPNAMGYSIFFRYANKFSLDMFCKK